MYGERLAEAAPKSGAEIASIAVAIARQVAELHRNDIVHGHVRPSSVTVDGDAVALDPPGGVGFSKPHDVRSIGELTLWLLSRNGLRATGALADAARAAAALNPAARPTADQLVERLERVVAAPEGKPARASGQKLALPVLVAAGAAAVVLAVAAAGFAWSRGREHVAPAPLRPAVAPASAASARPDPLPAQVWPDAIRACEDVVTPLVADLDGDGCEEPLEFVAGRFVGPGGSVEIDAPGLTHHVTGDWHCSRVSTLAGLERASGKVFVFPRWAQPGHQVRAVLAAQLPGARSLLSGDVDGDGCDDLRALTAAGTEITIDVPLEEQEEQG